MNNHEKDTEKNPSGFRQDMQARHIVMLAVGGVIGTGLFLASGYTVSQAGPAGAVIAYLVGALMVYCVMMCLGELAVHMPETGSFSSYATRFLGGGTGYAVAWLYWLSWTVAIGSELIGAGVLMERWFPGVPVWIWAAVFSVVVLGSNMLSVRVFAETEFWLSLIKALTVLVFIIIGAAAITGFLSYPDAHETGLSNFTREGWFPTGFSSIGMALLAVAFAFAGTEVIGIAAGETSDPKKNVPRALKATMMRLAIFFVGTIIVIATLLPREQAGLAESPFVTVFSKIGIPYAADIMNLVIITALISAANSGLYASARMLWTLGDQGQLPRLFCRLTPAGIPLNAIIFSMLGGLTSLFSSFFAADTVYLALVSVAGVAIVIVWMAIAASQMAFRRRFLDEGGQLTDLGYKVRWYPWVPLIALISCGMACVGIAFDPQQRIALYFSLPFIGFCYLAYYVGKYRKANSLVKDKATA